MGKYPVTQEQWQVVIQRNPSLFQGNPRNPVEEVNYYDVVDEFIPHLAAKGIRGLRLPTMKEWSYAADFKNSHPIEEFSWYSRNSEQTTHPVGEKRANSFGLYDMAGNVQEWTTTKTLCYFEEEGYVCCGSSWRGGRPNFSPFRLSYRVPESSSPDAGFRLLKEI